MVPYQRHRYYDDSATHRKRKCNLRNKVSSILSAYTRQFDLKFSRGDVVINFPKLDYLQKQHFQRYVNEGGEQFEAIVDQLLELVKESTKSEVM